MRKSCIDADRMKTIRPANALGMNYEGRRRRMGGN